MPSWPFEQPETVAGGFRGADAPARSGCARFQIVRRPQQKERQARGMGGKLEPLAQFQIELVDHAGDGSWRARMQRFFQRPQRIFALRGLDQDQAARIEAESVEAMAVKPALFAQPVGGHNENERPALEGQRLALP
jgi:hypothetical protein